MSDAEKLRLMELLWADLSIRSDTLNSPDWHREELEKTEARRKAGLEPLMTLEDAKKGLLDPSQ